MKLGVHVGAPCLLLFLTFGWTWGQSPNVQNTNFTRPIFNCGGHLVTDSGFLGSEGFPSYYKPNRKCTWYITVPEGHVVMLSFRIFDLEADPRCRFDYVDVYNGHSYAVQKLGRFCGTFRPGALISTSNTMMLEMVSDAGLGGRGFLAYFSGGKPHVDEHQFCGGRLTKAEGAVKTPNWPESNYPAGISCSWHITVEPNMIIEVKFDKFDMEADSYCRYDYVAFFNGGETDDSRRIGKYCGDVVPENIVTNGNELLVQFVSDLSVTSDGFRATYSSIPQGSKPPTAGHDVAPGPRVDATSTSPTKKPKPRPAVKPAVKPSAKPKVKPTAKPKVKAPAKPTTRPAVVKPVTKPSAKPKPGSKPTPKPGSKPTPKPRIKPTPKPGAKVVIKPSPKPGTKPIPKPGTKPGSKPTPKPGTKPIPKPGSKPTPKPGTKPIPKTTTKPGTKPIPKPGTKPLLKPGTKPKTKPDAKPKPKAGAGKNGTGPVVKRLQELKLATTNPLCAQVCKGNSGLPASFCSAEFVLTGKVTALAPGSRGSVHVSVSVLKAYKPGRLSLARAGKAASVKLLSTCKSCPLLRRGMTYILTGRVDSEGRGLLEPSSFTFPYKASLQKQLANLTSRTC
ncbi:procollagen C-endopeptidase enhancer 2-like [Anguilla anguilla]|uniref:procollagen C-endopeptidase enhancer 2-like n=1 Tax=Anguilla anguilla TaxID=7936 RepID=UPI0015AFE070|nr:procollagen C-endopeptidase enhancer 2-like [Anguilla anguilla]